MHTRPFGTTGRAVGEIGLGTWQLGGDWGDVSEDAALATLRAAHEGGVTFIDTADVYGAGRSESIIGRFLRDTPGARDKVFIATKLGRNNWPNGFTRDQIRGFTEASLRRLGVEALDLTQTHCIPFDVMRRGEVFGWLDELKREGKLRAWGASVETTDEARYCVEQGGAVSLQIIFNIFRQKPIHDLFAAARAKHVALIVRLPLASGLLGGKMTKQTTFAAGDHRTYNRDGQKFNAGETFAGLPFAQGVELADALKPLVPSGWTLADLALRWCLDFDAVTVLIPGAKNPEQARANLRAAARPPLGAELHVKLAAFYERAVAAHIRGAY